MERVTFHQKPQGQIATMLVAFNGWADAAEAATGAIRFLLRKLSAVRMAELDPEDFYDFSATRPIVTLDASGRREITWPSNEFFFWQHEDGGLLLFLGREPNLKWRTFCSTLLDVAQECGVKSVISLGALLDAVPHSREPRISGSANNPEIRAKLEELGVRQSRYQGPTGITSVLYQACAERGIFFSSLWGHSPHYIQGGFNPKVCYSLLRALGRIALVPADLEELRSAGVVFEEQCQKIVAKEPALSAYIRQLEEAYEEPLPPGDESPNAEELMKDLDSFLKGQRQEKNRPEDTT